HLPAVDKCGGNAVTETLSFKRRPSALVENVFRCHDFGFFGFHQYKIGKKTGADESAAVNFKTNGRSMTRTLHNGFERKNTFFVQLKQRGKRVLNEWPAGGRLKILLLLFV